MTRLRGPNHIYVKSELYVSTRLPDNCETEPKGIPRVIHLDFSPVALASSHSTHCAVN